MWTPRHVYTLIHVGHHGVEHCQRQHTVGPEMTLPLPWDKLATSGALRAFVNRTVQTAMNSRYFTYPHTLCVPLQVLRDLIMSQPSREVTQRAIDGELRQMEAARQEEARIGKLMEVGAGQGVGRGRGGGRKGPGRGLGSGKWQDTGLVHVEAQGVHGTCGNGSQSWKGNREVALVQFGSRCGTVCTLRKACNLAAHLRAAGPSEAEFSHTAAPPPCSHVLDLRVQLRRKQFSLLFYCIEELTRAADVTPDELAALDAMEVDAS